mgnify:CR=1 FL=1|jgi:hypothetical protein|tara:strand:- start:2600 stop:3628 length:1029 start_codon:yes stop_codon:yes gene_type:complete
MAYLDNSGDIILDAVLTDTGRKAMAKGEFKITKYAFGDDEINYELFALDHPSGSAYAGLEILQTPVFEAFTEGDPLKYGLTSNRNLNLFYMPDLLFNDGKWGTYSVTKKNYVVYVAVNSETEAYLRDDTTGWGTGYATLAGQRAGGHMITIESCIDNADVSMTSANLENYIASTNMLDGGGSVTYDSNFITSIMSQPAGVNYATTPDGSIAGGLAPTLTTRTGVIPSDKPGFRTTKIGLNKAAIYLATGGGSADVTAYVQSKGIVGSMATLNVSVPVALTTNIGVEPDTRWSRFGQTGATAASLNMAGGSGTFATIETSLTITGQASGASLNIPITLIRRDA